jgi:hypothetical protein
MAFLSQTSQQGGGAIMMIILLLQAVEKPEISIWGVIIPALIFIVAFLMTLTLYRHFAGQQQESIAEEDSTEDQDPDP